MGQNILTLLHIFRGSGPPNPRIYPLREEIQVKNSPVPDPRSGRRRTAKQTVYCSYLARSFIIITASSIRNSDSIFRRPTAITSQELLALRTA